MACQTPACSAPLANALEIAKAQITPNSSRPGPSRSPEQATNHSPPLAFVCALLLTPPTVSLSLSSSDSVLHVVRQELRGVEE